MYALLLDRKGDGGEFLHLLNLSCLQLRVILLPKVAYLGVVHPISFSCPQRPAGGSDSSLLQDSRESQICVRAPPLLGLLAPREFQAALG